MKLSETIPKLMYKVLKNATHVVQGFIFFRNRTIIEVEFDQEECEALLEKMIINKDNVLRYLDRKYIPTEIENGMFFKDQSCIQKAILKDDGSMIIHINKSEAHKLITDTIHVRKLFMLRDKKFNNKIKYYINQLQIAYQDTLLYNEILKSFGMKPPSASLKYQKELLYKYGKLENIAKIKKRSIKRKFLRYMVFKGDIIWTELRKVINIEDFSTYNIKKVCNEIRLAAKDRGVKVTW